jgi:hypothetical protein
VNRVKHSKFGEKDRLETATAVLTSSSTINYTKIVKSLSVRSTNIN